MSEVISDVISEVKKLTNNYTTILSLEDAKRLKLHKGVGNGTGDRQLICKLFCSTYIYGDKTSPKTYPIDIDLSEFDTLFSDYKQNRRNSGILMNRGVCGFFIHHEITSTVTNRPIRQDIRDHYRQCVCIVCGTSKTICDHKNDLYNDERVLHRSTQTLDDFQPLCNGCNLRKRAVMVKTLRDNQRQPPPPMILNTFGISFTQGDESLDRNDIHAMVGTYWYDPVAFIKECIHRISHTI